MNRGIIILPCKKCHCPNILVKASFSPTTEELPKSMGGYNRFRLQCDNCGNTTEIEFPTLTYAITFWNEVNEVNKNDKNG